jgi:lysine 2,3-aminomutase
LYAVVRKTEGDAPWKEILSASVCAPEALPAHVEVDRAAVREVSARYPMRINPYYLGLVQSKGDPIYRQCVPDRREIADEAGYEDPLNEEGLSPVPGITHRYPDRVLFLVSSRCAVYCRFCNRKRKVGKPGMVTGETILAGLEYIRQHREVRDVLLSGGDPLLLDNQVLSKILQEVRAIPHVEIIRIGSRAPCTLPQRITPQLAKLLKRFHPLYVQTHFNHPSEITDEAALACERLSDAGIPVGCQTVLLKGVNDGPGIMQSLMRKLVAVRVRPYYLFQADLARGTSHFWTPLSRGLDIMDAMHGHISGLCVPHFAIDLPGGGGKVRLVPERVVGVEGDDLLVKSHVGRIFRYPLMGDKGNLGLSGVGPVRRDE